MGRASAAVSRRRWCIGIAALAASCPRRAAAAASLPVPLQAELLVKVASYDRGLRARAGDCVRTLVITRAGDVQSERVAVQLVSCLKEVPRIADLPHVEQVVPFVSATALAERCKAERISTLFFTDEVGADNVAAIGVALSGVNVLTAAPNAELVRRGAVLGFDLVSSKAKLYLNLPQAQKQGISMSAELIKLMTVFT